MGLGPGYTLGAFEAVYHKSKKVPKKHIFEKKSKVLSLYLFIYLFFW